jgi:hypothetical protein
MSVAKMATNGRWRGQSKTTPSFHMKTSRYLVPIVVILAISMLSAFMVFSLGATQPMLSTWVWDSPHSLSDKQIDTLIEQAHANSFSVIYLTVDEYININQITDTSLREFKKNEFERALEKFIRKASVQNIAVDAVAGWRDWAKPSERWKAFAMHDFFVNYNRTHSYRLRELQYDIEPYLMPEYEHQKEQVLADYLELVAQLTHNADITKTALSFVIPHFFDEKQEWTPKVLLNGRSDYTFNHMVRLLDTLPKSSLIIMAYRNFTDGDDGSIALSQAEVDYASSHATHISLIVAQEMGPEEPSYVSFYGSSKNAVRKAVETIFSHYQSSRAFQGIGIHYLNPYLDLPDT